jgi:hypothetical protein
MTKEEDVLAALDKPLAIHSLQQRLDPSNKSSDAPQELLIRMRADGKVKLTSIRFGGVKHEAVGPLKLDIMQLSGQGI